METLKILSLISIFIWLTLTIIAVVFQVSVEWWVYALATALLTVYSVRDYAAGLLR